MWCLSMQASGTSKPEGIWKDEAGQEWRASIHFIHPGIDIQWYHD